MNRLELLKNALEIAQANGAYTLDQAEDINQNFKQLAKEFTVMAQLIKQYEAEREQTKEEEKPVKGKN